MHVASPLGVWTLYQVRELHLGVRQVEVGEFGRRHPGASDFRARLRQPRRSAAIGLLGGLLGARGRTQLGDSPVHLLGLDALSGTKPASAEHLSLDAPMHVHQAALRRRVGPGAVLSAPRATHVRGCAPADGPAVGVRRRVLCCQLRLLRAQRPACGVELLRLRWLRLLSGTALLRGLFAGPGRRARLGALPGQVPQRPLVAAVDPGKDARAEPALGVVEVEGVRQLQPRAPVDSRRQRVHCQVPLPESLHADLALELPQRLLELLPETPVQLLPHVLHGRARERRGVVLVHGLQLTQAPFKGAPPLLPVGQAPKVRPALCPPQPVVPGGGLPRPRLHDVVVGHQVLVQLLGGRHREVGGREAPLLRVRH